MLDAIRVVELHLFSVCGANVIMSRSLLHAQNGIWIKGILLRWFNLRELLFLEGLPQRVLIVDVRRLDPFP
jgi:hypothetical protein